MKNGKKKTGIVGALIIINVYTPRMENHMEKNMENDMEIGVILRFFGDDCQYYGFIFIVQL